MSSDILRDDSVFSSVFLNRKIWKAGEMIEILKRSYLVLKELDETFEFSDCRFSNMSSQTLWYKCKISVLVFFFLRRTIWKAGEMIEILDMSFGLQRTWWDIFEFSECRVLKQWYLFKLVSSAVFSSEEQSEKQLRY